MNTLLKVSVIVTTYNRPDALRLVLEALSIQAILPFEVIIADDGSSNETRELIDKLRPQVPYLLKHVWQEDQGFQAAKIRNKAVAVAEGEYLIFLDGDCVPLVSFVRRHLFFAEKEWFIAGNRVLLSEQLTEKALHKKLTIYHWQFGKWLKAWITRDCNRLLPLFVLPLPQIFRKFLPQCWKGSKACNLGLWKKDFVAVNGFDEKYQGWGYEDSDLAIRLQAFGCRHKIGRFAIPVVHLWHHENDRSQQISNLNRLMARRTAGIIRAELGFSQYGEA